MGGSINTVFAKLADRHLDPKKLKGYAARFGFGRPIPFDLKVPASPADIPGDRLEFARTAAGFWHVHMSPLHGAVIAATVANRGLMPRPFLVDRVIDTKKNRVVYHAPQVAPRRVLPKRTVGRTAEMMCRTVSDGTARKAFFDRKNRPFLPGIRVAGKTGTLSGVKPYRGFTWWVGFAPYDKPEIALAALVVNTPKWRIKASYLAREALRYYLVERPKELRRRKPAQPHT